MNALIRPHHFLPCPARSDVLQSWLLPAGGGTVRSAAEAVAARRPGVRGEWRERFTISKGWRRANRFAGGLLIGAALWAMVFAASAATQFVP